MWASSCWKRRTRVSPVSAPAASFLCVCKKKMENQSYRYFQHKINTAASFLCVCVCVCVRVCIQISCVCVCERARVSKKKSLSRKLFSAFVCLQKKVTTHALNLQYKITIDRTIAHSFLCSTAKSADLKKINIGL